jgi:hypothetical protein
MKQAFVLAFILFCPTIGARSVCGAGHGSLDSTTASLDRIINSDLSEGTVLLALSTLAVDFRVPIGFEQHMDSWDKVNRGIHLRSGTLKSILDSLVAQEPSYKWELRDGVINVTPVVGRDQFLAQFLETRVARYVSPAGTTDKFKLRDAVLDLPEVRQFLELSAIGVRPYDYPYKRSIYSTHHISAPPFLHPQI